jgi:hypothetical protein
MYLPFSVVPTIFQQLKYFKAPPPPSILIVDKHGRQHTTHSNVLTQELTSSYAGAGNNIQIGTSEYEDNNIT